MNIRVFGKTIRERSTPFTIAIIFLIVVLIVIGGHYIFRSSFLQDFSSNFLSTILGVIVGIPIAFWTSNYQDRVAEKERKTKILHLLQEELFVNLTQLSGWLKSPAKYYELFIMGGFLKDEVWKSFSDGGELQWIKDPTLLNQLSWAYSSIKTVKYISEKYFTYAYLPKGENRMDIDRGKAEDYMRKMLDKGMSEACERISEALKAIG
jgi:hypothetical protein